MATERVMTVNAPDVDWNGIPFFPAGEWKRAVGKTRSGSCHTEVVTGWWSQPTVVALVEHYSEVPRSCVVHHVKRATFEYCAWPAA